MTFDQIQSAIFDQYDRIGHGEVLLANEDHFIGDSTLLIPNEISLVGRGTKLIGNGKLVAGFGPRKDAGAHEGGSIRGFKIIAPNGVGIGPHASASSLNAIIIEDIFPVTKLAAISITQHEMATGVYINRVRKNTPGALLEIYGNAVSVNNVEGGYATLIGVGSVTDSQFHDGIPGRATAYVNGTWHIDAWIETIGGMQLTDAHVTSSAATWTAQPKQPVRMLRSRLDIVGPVPFQDNNGGQPKDAAARTKLIAQCYPMDKSSGVYQAGKLVIGAAI